MFKFCFFKASFFLYLLMLCLLFVSAGFSKENEINIDADKMEIFEDEGVAVFTGKVFATTKDMKLWADKLYVYYAKNNQTGSTAKRELQRVIAIGRVKIEKEKWKAICGKATYYKDQEKLYLEENPKVWHEDNLVEGDLIIVYFKEDRSEVFSKEGGRVRVKFYGK
ncbi:MAG: lipopolysaccharide transport periplasmic protein LptA [Caldimicrobium sp.]